MNAHISTCDASKRLGQVLVTSEPNFEEATDLIMAFKSKEVACGLLHMIVLLKEGHPGMVQACTSKTLIPVVRTAMEHVYGVSTAHIEEALVREA